MNLLLFNFLRASPSKCKFLRLIPISFNYGVIISQPIKLRPQYKILYALYTWNKVEQCGKKFKCLDDLVSSSVIVITQSSVNVLSLSIFQQLLLLHVARTRVRSTSPKLFEQLIIRLIFKNLNMFFICLSEVQWHMWRTIQTAFSFNAPAINVFSKGIFSKYSSYNLILFLLLLSSNYTLTHTRIYTRTHARTCSVLNFSTTPSSKATTFQLT